MWFMALVLFCRFELALQQNEILDVFYDDYFSLADDETTFGAKSDNYLKVCAYIWLTSVSTFYNKIAMILLIWLTDKLHLGIAPILCT